MTKLSWIGEEHLDGVFASLLALCFFSLFLQDTRDVTHVDQIARLLVMDDVEDFELDGARAFSLRSVLVFFGANYELLHLAGSRLVLVFVIGRELVLYHDFVEAHAA